MGAPEPQLGGVLNDVDEAVTGVENIVKGVLGGLG